MKEIYEKKGSGCSIRGIADDLGIARNTVRRYLRTPEAMRPKPRAPRGSKLDPYMEYIDGRMGEGLENCRVMQRELRALGYDGSYTILADLTHGRWNHIRDVVRCSVILGTATLSESWILLRWTYFLRRQNRLRTLVRGL